jgi:Ubiquitin carboxyl-terminal hydrolase
VHARHYTTENLGAGDATDADGDEAMAPADGGDDSDHAGAHTGRYELIAVLTHKGRTLDSGHYIGWVKQSAPDSWVQFDDDKLIMRKDEDITALSGGGDWHTAYLLLFHAQKVPHTEDANGITGKVDAGKEAEIEPPASDAPPAAAAAGGGA